VTEQLLSFRIEERLVEYDPQLRVHWRDPTWWDAGEWRDFLPEAEWHRVDTKFRTQAVVSGNHFVEVMHMRELARAGLSWRYEGYDFFEPASPTAKMTVEGNALISAAFPAVDLDRLHQAAMRYRFRSGRLPGTPDLFVYRADASRIVPVRFVELKHGRTEGAAPHQLLGLALIQEILGADVQIVRYAPKGSGTIAKTWAMDWPRGGYIPDKPNDRR
jgi:hypothetical protein